MKQVEAAEAEPDGTCQPQSGLVRGFGVAVCVDGAQQSLAGELERPSEHPGPQTAGGMRAVAQGSSTAPQPPGELWGRIQPPGRAGPVDTRVGECLLRAVVSDVSWVW